MFWIYFLQQDLKQSWSNLFAFCKAILSRGMKTQRNLQRRIKDDISKEIFARYRQNIRQLSLNFTTKTRLIDIFVQPGLTVLLYI